MKTIHFFFSIFFVFISTIIYSQNNTVVRGTIVDAETVKGVSGVEIKPTNFMGTVTDLKGNFSLELPPGSHSLTITHIAYQSKLINIEVGQSEGETLFLKLEKAPIKLKEVVIRERNLRDPYRNNISIIRDVLEPEELDVKIHKDVGEMLSSIPNVSGVRKGGSTVDPVIRGYKFSQLLIVVDNAMRIEGGCPNRMDPAVSHIDAGDLSRIEVFKGPYALRFGPSLGGVINLLTLSPENFEKGLSLNASRAWISNHNALVDNLQLYTGSNKAFVQLSANKKDYGDYKDGYGNTVSAAFKKSNINLKTGFLASEKHYLGFSIDRSFGRNVHFPALPMDERSDDTWLASADYLWSDISDKIRNLSARIYFTEVHHVMDNKERSFSDTVVAISDITANTFGYRLESEIKNGSSRFFIGSDLNRSWKDGDRTKNLILQPDMPVFKEALWNEAHIINSSLFIEWNGNYGEWQSIAALRLDYNVAGSGNILLAKGGNTIYENNDNDSEYLNVSASAGISRKFGEYSKMSLSIGRGVRSPDMIERFIILLPVGYDEYDYLGNPSIKPEVNYEADLQYDQGLSEFGHLTLTAFASMVNDYIIGELLPPSQQMPLSNDVLGVKQFSNIDHVFFRGFELSYQSPKMKPLSLSFSTAFTYASVEQTEKAVYENGELISVELVDNDALNEIPPLESQLLAKYSFPGNLMKLSFRLRAVASQQHVSESFNESSSPGFVLADFSLSASLNKYIKFNAGVTNIFDKAYYEHLNRRIIGSNADYYEAGRSFFIRLSVNI